MWSVGKGLQRVLLQIGPCRDKEEVNNGSLDVGAMKELEKMQKERERLKVRHNGTAEQSGLAGQAHTCLVRSSPIRLCVQCRWNLVSDSDSVCRPRSVGLMPVCKP